jgi:hypothetical protein
MRGKRITAVLAAAAALGASAAAIAIQPAQAASSSVPITTYHSNAWNLSASGKINVKPTLAVHCTYPAESANRDLLTLPGIGTLSALKDSCSVVQPGQTATAVSDVARASLFGGQIVLTGIHSECDTDVAGNTTFDSAVATVNGAAIPSGTHTIPIGNLATVIIDNNVQTPANPMVNDNVSVSSEAVTVIVAPQTTVVLGKTITIPGETITLGHCDISGLSEGGGGGLG